MVWAEHCRVAESWHAVSVFLVGVGCDFVSYNSTVQTSSETAGPLMPMHVQYYRPANES